MTSFTAKAAVSQSGAPLQTYFIANEPSMRSSLSSRALSSAFSALRALSASVYSLYLDFP